MARKNRIDLILIGFFIQLTTMAFGRFAYTLILPDMMKSLGFSVTRMGILGMGIVTGYLVNSLFSGTLSNGFGEDTVVKVSMISLSFALFCLGYFSNFIVLLAASILLGAGASGSYIPLAALINTTFHERGKAFGIVTGGAGAGIMVCGYLIPFILSRPNGNGYQAAWYALAVINAIVFLPSLFFLKKETPPDPTFSNPIPEKSIIRIFRETKPLRLISIIYFLLGFSYIIYATYFGAYAMEEIGFSPKSTGIMWSLFGINLIYSGIFWGSLADRFNKITVSIIVNLLLALSLFIIIPFRLEFLFYISTFLFGFSFMGFLTVIYLIIGEIVQNNGMGKAFGASTLLHGAGQVISTFIAGFLKDITGTYKIPLLISLGGLLLCVIVFFRLKNQYTFHGNDRSAV
ncbi:MAG: YbfB/YjiJ family MFS transporter [Spirochaetes bacterium]|nr:YbfB/YjiJ family MFS transporter [Spirochaetota bacterium]